MIKFIKCTAAQYAAAKTGGTLNDDYFYYLTDADKFYLGEIELSNKDLPAYLTEVVAADDSIVVTNNNEVGVQISAKTGNSLSLETGTGEEGLYVAVPTQTDYTVAITESAGSSSDLYSKRYRVQQAASSLDVNIDIPKDMVVEEGTIADITYNDGHLYDGATDVTEIIKGQGGTATAADAGKYIKLTIANATSDKIYIAAKDLVDIYTAQPNATQVQLAIDSNNVISATIVTGSIGTTELSSSIVTSLGKADSALQASDIAEGSTDGTISVKGTDVSVHGLGSAAYADTTDFDAAGSAAAVLGQSTDTASSITVYGDRKYAESLLEWQSIS